MNRRSGNSAAAATGFVSLAVLLVLGRGAAAQDRPSENDLFGGAAPAKAPDDATTPDAAAPKPPDPDPGAPPPAPSATAASATPASATPASAPTRDAAILGATHSDMFSEEPAPDDPLEIGGQLYLRAQSTALEGQAFRDYGFSTPALLDVYLDARPNDRVRGFVLGRMSVDSTLPSSSSTSAGSRGPDATGGTAGSPSPATLFAPQTRAPHVVLDQLWLRFDVAHTVFVTAGKQHVRWGTGRFWAPTDYLHIQRRNPLDVFDARSGTTLIKLHLPIESRAWNFYAFAVTESSGATSTLGSLAGAARAEFVLGPTELGLGTYVQRDRKPKWAADLSMGIGDVDVYGELALRSGQDIDRVRYNPDAVVPEFAAAPSWEEPADTARRQLAQVVDAFYPVYRSSGLKAQVVGGLSYSRKYNDNDTFTLGAEYFYNGLGHHGPLPYPGLVLPHSTELVDATTFFYLGQQYAAVFLALPSPYSLDNHSFTLSSIGNFSDLSFITRFDYSLVLLTHLRFEAFVSARYGHENGEFRFGVDQLDLGGVNFSRAPALADFGMALRIDI